MKSSALVFLAVLSTAAASGSLRGEAREESAPIPIACTLKGGSSQDACDATLSEDGSKCVWCSVSSYAFCVNRDMAIGLEQTIPGMDCDEDDIDDDDAPEDDDVAPAADDDTAPTDDSVPPDYWKCKMDYKDSGDCSQHGCTWCNTKGGYGVCMDDETAKSFADFDWYDCGDGAEETLEDPNDPSCLVASLEQDADACKETMDAEGKPCEWCSLQGYDFCMNVDQAAVVEGYGASCGDDRSSEDILADPILADPNDPSCLVASLEQDGDACKATMDAEGKPCEWCSLQGYDICMNIDQAAVAEGYGASCGDDRSSEDILADPNDPSCLVASLEQDPDACKETMDAEGKPCEWCSLQGYDFCMNVDQAAMAEGYGASCGDDRSSEDILADPNDPSCLVASLEQDADACKATMDADGNPCEWCSLQGYDICMNIDQAAVAEGYGASCGDDRAEEQALKDPDDLSCIAATLEQDEDACKATMDADGNPCEWCSLEGYDFCMNADQAAIAEQSGASCDAGIISSSIA